MNDTHDPVTGEIPAQSAKREKFHRIAVRRTKGAMKAIRNISTMGGRNRYSYEFSASDVDEITKALEDEIAHLRLVMVAPGRQLDVEFDL